MVAGEAKWVRRWVRQFGIHKVREGIIKYVMDRLEGNEWEALQTRLEMGQVALSSATTEQLISELEDWSVGSGADDQMVKEEFERIQEFIAGPLEGEAKPDKEASK